MLVFDIIAEARIAEASARGEFKDLPGAGRPLELDDDRLVPPELRVAYRMLKNAGFVPPEIEARREITGLRAIIASLGGESGEPARRRALTRLALLEERLEANGSGLRRERAYYGKLIERFGG